jgi:hypothetical protein
MKGLNILKEVRVVMEKLYFLQRRKIPLLPIATEKSTFLVQPIPIIS